MDVLVLPSYHLAAAAIVSLALFALSRRTISLSQPSVPLPPGPPGKPLLGNLGQISDDHPEMDYIRWGKEYDSDIIYTRVLGQNMITLNTVEAATDLLDRRGSNYCDRPRFALFEVMGWGLTLTFLRWGPRFKLHRGLFQMTFSKSNIKNFRPSQLHEARKAVSSLLSDPSDWKDITLLMATSIIFRVAFGQEVSSKDSHLCHLSRAAIDATTAGGIAGSTLLDLFPPIRFLPSWIDVSEPLKHARRSRETIRTIHDVPWDTSLKDMSDGTGSYSFMRTHLERLWAKEEKGKESNLTEADIKGATGAIFIAGGNTTWSTIQSCMLFLTKQPHCQKRLQQELDAVIGPDRLPAFDDMPSLPYLSCFIDEVLRCLPLNPLVIPHKSLRDDVYRGMFIPKGSIIFANAKAMATDASVYRDPEAFDPERYLRGEPAPPGNFGFGRRKCPGNLLALASVQIFLATLMAAFDVERVIGHDGVPIDPKVGITIGLGGCVCVLYFCPRTHLAP